MAGGHGYSFPSPPFDGGGVVRRRETGLAWGGDGGRGWPMAHYYGEAPAATDYLP